MKRTPTLDRLGYKSFYRRNLPHIQPLNSALFVTFRLAGSLPEEVLARMAEERRQIELTFKGDTAKARSSLGALALVGISLFCNAGSTGQRLAPLGLQMRGSRTW